MMFLEGFLVAFTVLACNFIENWLSYPMLARPMMVGPIVGFLLGDLSAGILMGANCELVFMGVVGIGGTQPPDAVVGTATGTAFAIMMGADVEVALTLAVPIALMTSMINPIFTSLSVLSNSWIEKMVERGDYKMLEKMPLIKSLIGNIPKAIVVMLAVAMGSNAVQAVVEQIPEFVTGGLSVAGGMMAAVGFAMLLRMMWSKTMCVYFFLGFVLSAYLGLPIMAIAFLGIIIAVMLYFEGAFAKGTVSSVTANNEEEDLFDD